MSTNDLIQRYYDSLNQKNDTWQELWADEATFSDASKAINALGIDAVIASFTPFLKGVAAVQIKQLISEGDDICVIARYDYINPKGEKLSQDVAEVWKVKDERLFNLTIYFDLTAYRSFMRG